MLRRKKIFFENKICIHKAYLCQSRSQHMKGPAIIDIHTCKIYLPGLGEVEPGAPSFSAFSSSSSLSGCPAVAVLMSERERERERESSCECVVIARATCCVCIRACVCVLVCMRMRMCIVCAYANRHHVASALKMRERVRMCEYFNQRQRVYVPSRLTHSPFLDLPPFTLAISCCIFFHLCVG